MNVPTHLDARLDGLVHGLLEALPRVPHQLLRPLRRRAHEEGLVEVAVVAAVEHGHVDVHDVTVLLGSLLKVVVRFHVRRNHCQLG